MVPNRFIVVDIPARPQIRQPSVTYLSAVWASSVRRAVPGRPRFPGWLGGGPAFASSWGESGRIRRIGELARFSLKGAQELET